MSEPALIIDSESRPQAGPMDGQMGRFFKAISVPSILVLLTVVAFWPARHCDFINYDDPFYVASNRHVLGGLTREGFIWAFRTTQTANWHPLTWLSYMTDISLFGLN